MGGATMVPLVVETPILFWNRRDTMPSAEVPIIRYKVSTLQYRVERIILHLEKGVSLREEKIISVWTEELSWVVNGIEQTQKVRWSWVVPRMKPLVKIPLPWV